MCGKYFAFALSLAPLLFFDEMKLEFSKKQFYYREGVWGGGERLKRTLYTSTTCAWTSQESLQDLLVLDQRVKVRSGFEFLLA